MESILNKTSLSWHTDQLETGKKLALIIPLYNECTSNVIFKKRLQYFDDVSKKYADVLDVILVNDGSSDDSLEALQLYHLENDSSFHIANISPNRNKVGALYIVVVNIDHHFVLLSDFDTQIAGIDLLLDNIEASCNSKEIMGAYFRMLPFNGTGNIFLYQELEYSIARIYYKFHRKDQIIPVMPGAGSLYNRKILTEIYHKHSGLRNGEDRETTLIGYKKGYHAIYMNNILTLTSTPSTYKSLITQRIRWNLGYLETCYKERNFYSKLLLKQDGIAIRCFMDLLWVITLLLVPIVLIYYLLINPFYFVLLTASLYFLCALWASIMVQYYLVETQELSTRRVKAIVLFPIYKYSVDYIAWVGATLSFFKNLFNKRYS